MSLFRRFDPVVVTEYLARFGLDAGEMMQDGMNEEGYFAKPKNPYGNWAVPANWKEWPNDQVYSGLEALIGGMDLDTLLTIQEGERELQEALSKVVYTDNVPKDPTIVVEWAEDGKGLGLSKDEQDYILSAAKDMGVDEKDAKTFEISVEKLASTDTPGFSSVELDPVKVAARAKTASNRKTADQIVEEKLAPKRAKKESK